LKNTTKFNIEEWAPKECECEHSKTGPRLKRTTRSSAIKTRIMSTEDDEEDGDQE